MIGAALATGLSYSLGFFINIKPMFTKKSDVNVLEGEFSWNLLGKLLYNGCSEGITSVATAVSTWVFNLTFIHYYGDAGAESFAVVNYIGQLTTTLLFGMADGITPIVSFNYGENLRDRIDKTMKLAVICNFLISFFSFLVVSFLEKKLFHYLLTEILS